MATIDDFLAGLDVGEFRPYCMRCEESDSLIAYFKDATDYSERLTDHVTLFRSLDDDTIIGCKIKGATDIINDLPNYLEVNHDGINLSVLFLPFRSEASEAKAREALNALAKGSAELGLKLEPC